jgi:hypothetical protein
MSFNKRPIIGIALLALLYHACRRDEENFIIERKEVLTNDTIWASAVALNDTTVTINKLFQELALKPETKPINLTTGGTCSFSNGCSVNLPANCCTTRAGAIATGNATVELILIRSRGEMVSHRMETVSDGKCFYFLSDSRSTQWHYANLLGAGTCQW